jgi:uncharacterized protein (TIGR03435 family)
MNRKNGIAAALIVSWFVANGNRAIAQATAAETPPETAAQPTAKFDVASVKRAAPGRGPVGFTESAAYRNVHVQGRDHGRYTMYGVPLRIYLQLAYQLPPDRVSGPAWMDSERYDIVATMPADTPDPQVLLMLQNLLQERFQIKLHREQKETAVYALVVDKGGPKLQESVEGTPPGVQLGGILKAKNRSLGDLAAILMRWTDRPVVNLTGLDGHYDFELDLNPSSAPSSGHRLGCLRSPPESAASRAQGRETQSPAGFPGSRTRREGSRRELAVKRG